MNFALRRALVEAVQASRAPGAAAYVGNREETFLDEAFGERQTSPVHRSAKRDTPYDLASLTKVVATTTAVLLLRKEGVIDLDQPVSELLPIPEFSAFTVRHLLTHTSGLPAGKPLYREATSINEMLQQYASVGTDWPAGSRWRYSDIGFMILGKVVELAAKDRLDAFCARRIFNPHGMNRTAFAPPPDWKADCAATEQCAWRRKVLVGEVHDENAYAVGGVAGHAGLFSTAGDLACFCRALLAGKLLPEETLAEMTRIGQVACHPWQGLGWYLDPWSSKPTGFLPARTAFGHTGWTGTSLWMDRQTGFFAILLGNTCHPSRARRDNESFRRTFYTGMATQFYPASSNTHTGLDRLVCEDFSVLRGKRVALLTHHAAVDQLGRHILNVLPLAADVKVVLVYSPEHGLRGQAEAGAAVPSEKAAIPVISLMGERSRPVRAELDYVDALVVDLQDVGARYYTYIATMKECMAACVEAGKPVIVLDRPNPVGGVVLEGPIAVTTKTPVCCAAVPIRHGMTIGEMALHFRRNDFRNTNLDLQVLPLDNWRRDLLFDDCSLPWIPPSPNMPTAQTALLYVGTCLFEGTHLNEGRGTETPFHVLGAPWLDAAAVIRQVKPEERPGCELDPITYTPTAIPGKATHPQYRDEACFGIRIRVTKPHDVRAFTLAVALLGAIRRCHPDKFAFTPFFDILAGSPRLRARIEAGESAGDIIAGYAGALKRFEATRPRLYE